MGLQLFGIPSQEKQAGGRLSQYMLQKSPHSNVTDWKGFGLLENIPHKFSNIPKKFENSIFCAEEKYQWKERDNEPLEYKEPKEIRVWKKTTVPNVL